MKPILTFSKLFFWECKYRWVCWYFLFPVLDKHLSVYLLVLFCMCECRSMGNTCVNGNIYLELRTATPLNSSWFARQSCYLWRTFSPLLHCRVSIPLLEKWGLRMKKIWKRGKRKKKLKEASLITAWFIYANGKGKMKKKQ